MLAALVGVTIAGCQIPTSGDKLDSLAWNAGQREVVLGMRVKPRTSYGFYTFRAAQIYQRGDSFTPSEARIPIKKGAVTWSVREEEFEGRKCLLFETEGTRNLAYITSEKLVGGPLVQEASVTWGVTLGTGRKVWLDPAGRTLKQTYTTVTRKGTFFLSAKFENDEEVTVEMRSLEGERRFTLYPAGGRAVFDAEFSPMLDGESVILREKRYVTFDPISGALTQWQAHVGPQFSGSLRGANRRGRVVDLTSGQGSQRIFISDGGELLQVDLPDKSAILLDTRDSAEMPGLHRVYFGG